jgi:hypothetical protein
MTALYCRGCSHRFGRRATVWTTTDGTALLCGACAASRALHRRMWWSCPHPSHTPADHGCHAVTRGVAATLVRQ